MRGVTVLKLAAGKAVFQISFTLKNLTGIWPGRKFSIALAYSIDGPGARKRSRRTSNRPRREDRIYLRTWG